METQTPTTETTPSKPTAYFTLDSTQHMYGGIKNVWGFGSNFVLTKPFAKVTEAVAGKLLDVTIGMEFAGVDKEIKPKLAEIDNDFMNPAISSIVHAVEPFVQKVHSIIHPIVEPVLSGIGLKKPEALESEIATTGM